MRFAWKLAEIMAEWLTAKTTANRQNAPPTDTAGPPGQERGVRNEVSGTVQGPVIQAYEVHLHQAAAAQGGDHPGSGDGADG